MNHDLKELCCHIIDGMQKKDGKEFDFDSHDVIIQLDTEENSNVFHAALWELVSDEEKALVRRKLHSEIGRWIERNQHRLGIEFAGKHMSPNYKDDDSLNATWRIK